MPWILSFHWWAYLLAYFCGLLLTAVLIGVIWTEREMDQVSCVAFVLVWPLAVPLISLAVVAAVVVNWAREL